MEKQKSTKAALAIVIMLIITITSFISTLVMHMMMWNIMNEKTEYVSININELDKKIYGGMEEEISDTVEGNQS